MKIIYLIKSLRPKHWIKNIFVFPALIFADKFTDANSIILSIIAFIIFSISASSVYLINDVFDFETDRNHPVKKNRPIASGKVSKFEAVLLSIVLASSALGASLFLDIRFFFVICIYFMNNILYSFKFKHVVIIDIFMVAFGFVLRAVGGVYAIDVPMSSWFLIIIFLLTLFIAVMKRRQEFVEVEKSGGSKRKVLEDYSIEMIDKFAGIIIPVLLVSYIFFTFNNFHTELFMITIPLVLYGVFRYLFLIYKKNLGEDPTQTLLKDLPLAFTVIIWTIISMILIYKFN